MKTVIITLFLLLSLSYSSTMAFYDADFPLVETETLCEDMKEDLKKDSSVDSLDIVLTEKFCLSISLPVSTLTDQTEHYTTVYDDPLYKPPLFS